MLLRFTSCALNGPPLGIQDQSQKKSQHHLRHHRRRGPRITHRPASTSAYPSSVSIISCQHHHRHHRRHGLVLLIGRQACQHTLPQSTSSAVSIIMSIIVAVGLVLPIGRQAFHHVIISSNHHIIVSLYYVA